MIKEWYSTKCSHYLKVVLGRISERSETVGDCIEWTGKERVKGGYGRVRIKGKLTLVHRFVFEMMIGEIPNGYDVLHSCDNPRCINPKHLSIGDHADNMGDKAMKGRAPSKLSSDDVAAIYSMIKEGKSCNSISKIYGVCPHTIGDIKKGVTWHHVTKLSRFPNPDAQPVPSNRQHT